MTENRNAQVLRWIADGVPLYGDYGYAGVCPEKTLLRMAGEGRDLSSYTPCPDYSRGLTPQPTPITAVPQDGTYVWSIGDGIVCQHQFCGSSLCVRWLGELLLYNSQVEAIAALHVHGMGPFHAY